MTTKRPYRLKKAFTLIELLVVISIIALLLSILMPSLQKARGQAKMIVCKSNLHQVGLALLLYAGANDDRHPPQAGLNPYNKSWDSAAGKEAHETTWPFRLATYIGDGSYKYEADPQKNVMRSHPYLCPSQKNVKIMKYYKIGYATNYGTLFRMGYLYDDPVWPGPTKLSQIRHPSDRMAIMDSGNRKYPEYPSTFVYSAYQKAARYWGFIYDTNNNGIMDSFNLNYPFNNARFWHDGGKKTNAAFVDGHSESLSEREWVDRKHWTVSY